MGTHTPTRGHPRRLLASGRGAGRVPRGTGLRGQESGGLQGGTRCAGQQGGLGEGRAGPGQRFSSSDSRSEASGGSCFPEGVLQRASSSSSRRAQLSGPPDRCRAQAECQAQGPVGSEKGPPLGAPARGHAPGGRAGLGGLGEDRASGQRPQGPGPAQPGAQLPAQLCPCQSPLPTPHFMSYSDPRVHRQNPELSLLAPGPSTSASQPGGGYAPRGVAPPPQASAPSICSVTHAPDPGGRVEGCSVIVSPAPGSHQHVCRGWDRWMDGWVVPETRGRPT